MQYSWINAILKLSQHKLKMMQRGHEEVSTVRLLSWKLNLYPCFLNTGKCKDWTCLTDLSLYALLGDEGLQSSGLWVLGVAKVQDLCTNKHGQISVGRGNESGHGASQCWLSETFYLFNFHWEDKHKLCVWCRIMKPPSICMTNSYEPFVSV